MDEALRATVAVVLLVGGLALCGWAGYLQYVASPGEYTVGQRGKRAALALGGVASALVGAWLLN
jgi:hypothetical protein